MELNPHPAGLTQGMVGQLTRHGANPAPEDGGKDAANLVPCRVARRRLLLALLPGMWPALSAATPTGFELTDTQGRRHSLALHAGRCVLVNLWATWCTPCLAEMPEIQALGQARGDLVIIGLAVDGQLDPNRMAQYATRSGVTYSLVAGDMEMASQFKVRVLPTTLLFDSNGRLAYLKEGRVSRREINTALLGLGRR